MQLLNRYTFFIFIALLGGSFDGYSQDYYWVGGDGNWSDYQNHWATASNGGTFHTAPPGPGNDVYFDQNSFNGPNQTVTINVDAEFKSMNWSGVTNTPALAGSNNISLTIHGSLVLSPNMIYEFEGDINFVSDNKGNRINTEGQIILGSIIFDEENGNYGGWYLENPLTTDGNFRLNNGDFETRDFDLTVGGGFYVLGSGTTDFGSSMIKNEGTTTFSIQNNSARKFIGGDATFIIEGGDFIINNIYNNSSSSINDLDFGQLEFIDFANITLINQGFYVGFDTGGRLILNKGGQIKVQRFNNTTNAIVSPTVLELAGGYDLTLEAGMSFIPSAIISTAVDCSDISTIQSSIDGQRAFVNLTQDVYFFAFKNIANLFNNSITAFNSIDLGGNDRIIFDEIEGRKKYWIGGAGDWYDPSHWSFTPNGPGGECPPTPLDTVAFTNASFAAGANNLSVTNLEEKHIYFHDLEDESSAGNVIDLDIRTFAYAYGSVRLNNEVELNLKRIYFRSEDMGEEVILNGNPNLIENVYFNGIGGWTIFNQLDVFDIYLLDGSLDLGTANINAARFYIRGSNTTKNLNLNNSTVRLYSTGDSWSVTADNTSIESESGSKIYLKGGTTLRNLVEQSGNNILSYNDVYFNIHPNYYPYSKIETTTSTSNITNSVTFKKVVFETDGQILGENQFDSLIFSPSREYILESSTNQVINDFWLLEGSDCQGPISLHSSNPGIAAMVTRKNNNSQIQADFVDMSDIHITSSTAVDAGSNSKDLGNNVGWNFGTPTNAAYGFLGPDQYLCDSRPIIISNPKSGIAYQWYDITGGTAATPIAGETQNTLSVSNTGIFVGEVEILSGCFTQDTIEIFATDFLDSIYLGTDLTLCEGQTQTYQINIPGNVVQLMWNDNPADSLPTYTADSEGMVKLRGTFEGCIREDSVLINYDTVVPPNLNTPTLNLCFGTSTKLPLDRSLYTSVTWMDPNGNLVPLTEDSLPINSNGTYRLTVYNNSCFQEDSVSVTILPQFTVNLGSDQILCEGDPLSLDAGVIGATYQWTGPSLNETTKVIQPTLSGNYQVAVTVNNCTQTDDVNVTFNTTPVVNLLDEYFFCEGSSVSVTADNNLISSGAILNWSNGVTGDNSGPLSSSLTLILTADLNGCDASDSTDIVEQKLPILDFGFTDTTLCQGQSIALDATQNDPTATFEWRDLIAPNPSAILETKASYTTSTNGLYEVTASINGCSNTASGKVSFTTPPIVDLGLDTILCDGQTLTTPDLSFLNADRIIWSTTASTPSIPITAAGNYQVTVEKGGCVVQDDINVTFQALPVLNLPNNSTLCAGDTLLLDATQSDPNTTYEWSGSFAGFLNNNPSYVVRSFDDYTVVATINNCSASQTISVNYTPIPTNLNLGPDSVLCEGQVWNIDLSNLNADQYVWNTGSMSPTEQFDSSGTYEVTITINGCSATDAVQLDFLSYPVLDLGPSDTSLCDGQTLLLDVDQSNPITTYEWIDLATSNSTVISTDSVLSIINDGDYQITASNDKCSTTSSILVNYYPYPVFDLGSDTLLCEGESILLDPGLMTGQLEWNDQTMTPTKTVAQEGLYTLAVTVNNCTTTDSIQIDYISFTPNFLGANQNNLCDGEQIDLKVKDSFPGISYQWNDGTTASFLEVTQTGKYWVDVEVGRCKTTDTIDFVFNPLPIFNLGPDERLCEDQTIDLTINANSSTYRWSDGTTQASNTIRFPGGLIWAEAQNLYCSFRDSLFVNYDEYPLIDLGPDTTICDDRSVVLTAGANAEQLAWSTGSTDASIEVDKSGIYSLTATNGVCQITDDVEVVSRQCYYFNVFVPNAFSPNNDGVNDNLVPYFPLGVSVQEFSMSVFDRWGNILFQTKDINSTWDGYWNGQLMPEGVYIYYLEVSYVDDLGPGTARRNGDFILIK